MDVDENDFERNKLSWSLQILLILEWIPYFITAVFTTTFVRLALSLEDLDWDNVFFWRCCCFGAYSFLVLSLANYGDRLSNGRFWLFMVFFITSNIWTPLVLADTKNNSVVVLGMCLQPLMILREGPRMCYIFQMLRLTDHTQRIRTVAFFLFLIGNIGAIFACVALNVGHITMLSTALGLMPVYTLLASSAMLGSQVLAHRNITERGFKYLVKRATHSLTCNKNKKDFSNLYDEEIRTSTHCMIKISVIMIPVVLYFATVEMTFYIWIRDYDALQDLGFQDWMVTLADVYHIFNVVSALFIFVVLLPIVQCFTKVSDIVLIGLSYFVLLLSWSAAGFLQYTNQVNQTRYPGFNESKIVLFSNLHNPVAVVSYWTDKKFMRSGEVKSHMIWGISTDTWLEVRVFAISKGDPFEQPQYKRDNHLKAAKNSTTCYLVTSTSNETLVLRDFKINVLRHFQRTTKKKGKLKGHLLVMCSYNLFNQNLSLGIKPLRESRIEEIPICCTESKQCAEIVNITIGWHQLYLKKLSDFMPFEETLDMKKESLQYLYINLNEDEFSMYTGNISELITPFYVYDRSHLLVQVALFSVAYTLGIVGLHSFVVHSAPTHLLEHGFAIMYATWCVGAAIAGLVFEAVCISAGHMFYWSFVLVVGLFVFVRGAFVFLIEGGKCRPDATFHPTPIGLIDDNEEDFVEDKDPRVSPTNEKSQETKQQSYDSNLPQQDIKSPIAKKTLFGQFWRKSRKIVAEYPSQQLSEAETSQKKSTTPKRLTTDDEHIHQTKQETGNTKEKNDMMDRQ